VASYHGLHHIGAKTLTRRPIDRWTSRLDPAELEPSICRRRPLHTNLALAWAYERSAPFKQGQRFRAGIEGRVSVLMRGRGMKRCRAEGAERFALFVAAAVLANNLMIISELLTKRVSRRRKANR
jgi:hypothetical protein